MTDPRFPGGNYLDWLMHLDPLELSAQNIDEIIAAHREQRRRQATGEKPKRMSESVKIDLAELGLKRPPEPVKKRKI